MNPQTIKFIRSYVMRVYNDCSLLSFGRGMKDTDNNYYLLRTKDFLLDLFFCVFSAKNIENIDQINIQDIFILIYLVIVVGKNCIDIKIYDNRNDFDKKIECILNYLKVKPNEMCTFVNQDLEYYNYLIDYFDFYLDKFVNSNFNENNNNINKNVNYEEINTDIEPINALEKKEMNNPTKSKKIQDLNNININSEKPKENDIDNINKKNKILNSNESLE